ncbi:MAG: MarR family transcriptional regulator [Nocardioidaceae bacterium]|jgi:DNA-binding MarR family transcriptional regulator|nr:MarR family transcriptional regulator [Nocardioidaceae bacterium]
MARRTSRRETDAVAREQVDRVVEATRVVGALIAESLVSLEPALTMPQWRVLVLANEGDCNVSAVAEDLGVHMSNATRMCDRLVAAGLLERQRAEYDRRQVLLVLTDAGEALFGSAMEYRRRRIEAAMALMGPEDRAALASSSSVFIDAASRARMTIRSLG